MLITFRARNFRSLRDEVELSMVIPQWLETDHKLKTVQPDITVGTVAALYGSNASGKSTVLLAIWRMARFVVESHQDRKPTEELPHQPFFGGDSREKPSEFEMDFFMDGQRYQYGFEFNRTHVQKEWLYSYPKNRPRLLFDRDVERRPVYRFGRTLRGRPTIIAELTRPNSLFMSAAAANNHGELTRIVGWFDDMIQRVSPTNKHERMMYTTERMDDEVFRKRVIHFLKMADLGICGLSVVESDLDDDVRGAIASVIKAFSPELELGDRQLQAISRQLVLAHQVADHAPIDLDMQMESEGTTTWLAMAGPVLAALDEGMILLVDEIDSSLHPRLTAELVKMFHDPVVNTTGAQLIFNTHDPSLMGVLAGDSPLRRDEVWLTEKGRDGATRLYPLTEFRPRKAENLERGYLQGRYGGVPFVDQRHAAMALVSGEFAYRGLTQKQDSEESAKAAGA